MFHVHGMQGHIYSGTLEQLRQQRSVTAIARTRRVAPVDVHADQSAVGREASLAYGSAAAPDARHPLTCVADVMRSPAHTVSATATLGEAWQELARHGIGQAPVLDERGSLIGLVGRAGLMPAAAADMFVSLAEEARLQRPVTEAMWTPIPSAAPDTDLRRVAALLLDTGLPGVPVTDDADRLVGFVSRSDLLRALATDPPLDLWI